MQSRACANAYYDAGQPLTGEVGELVCRFLRATRRVVGTEPAFEPQVEDFRDKDVVGLAEIVHCSPATGLVGAAETPMPPR
jgi:hypothetical protein